MKINTLFFLSAGVVLATSHYLAIEFYLYWRYLWLDVPMHFLGGATAVLGLFVLRDLRLIGVNRWLSERWLRLDSVSLYIFLVVVLWEVFELVVGTPKLDNYTLDTTIDLVMGISGGLVAYYIGKRFINW